MSNGASPGAGSGHHDPPALAAFRFALELAAWIAIYFAWGWAPLVLAVGALALFTVPGDKHVVLVAVPGAVRIALEVGVASAGVAAAYAVWDARIGVPFLAVYVIFFALSYRRWIWMWRGGSAGTVQRR